MAMIDTRVQPPENKIATEGPYLLVTSPHEPVATFGPDLVIYATTYTMVARRPYDAFRQTSGKVHETDRNKIVGKSFCPSSKNHLTPRKSHTNKSRNGAPVSSDISKTMTRQTRW